VGLKSVGLWGVVFDQDKHRGDFYSWFIPLGLEASLTSIPKPQNLTHD
jgi:hypothetical protein